MKSKLIYQIYIYKQIKIIPNYHIKNKYIYIYILERRQDYKLDNDVGLPILCSLSES